MAHRRHRKKNPVAKNLPLFNQPKTFLDRKKELKKTGYKEDGKEDNSSGT